MNRPAPDELFEKGICLALAALNLLVAQKHPHTELLCRKAETLEAVMREVLDLFIAMEDEGR